MPYTFSFPLIEYFDIVERQGYNENSCDRTIIIIPMILSGDYPAPDVVVAFNYECFPVYLSQQPLANLLGVSLFVMNRPPSWCKDA